MNALLSEIFLIALVFNYYTCIMGQLVPVYDPCAWIKYDIRPLSLSSDQGFALLPIKEPSGLNRD